MPDQEPDGPSRQKRGAPSAEDLTARLQELVDSRPTDGYPLEWAVSAYFLGDVSALATLSLRS